MANNKPLLKAEHLTMEFRLPIEKFSNIKEYVVKLFRNKIKYKRFRVLDDINFEVHRGQSLGLIGHNGAGKSTLMKLIAGIYQPYSGSIDVNGTIAPLLNLGAGFDMEATGKENVFLNGAILGYNKKEMAKKYDSIVEFSGLHDFMSVPIKNYSSGMIARLGFAIAIDVMPDILLVDEILSVGDANFKKKCEDKIQEHKGNGVSFILVSHDMEQINKLCDKVIWIENSKVVKYGDTQEVIAEYEEYCKNIDNQAMSVN